MFKCVRAGKQNYWNGRLCLWQYCCRSWCWYRWCCCCCCCCRCC